MNQENNMDELDKILFKHFESNKEVPNYIEETIHNTLQKEKKQKKSINIMKKVAMIIVSFGIMTTGIVFADDIINFITSLFTNSTDGIDSAVQNGYIQMIDMEYICDNDIGVKIDNIVLDNTNLDISFMYNYQGNEKIDSLELYEYTIKDENDNILYEYKEKLKDELVYPVYVNRYNKTILIDNNTYKDSLIYTSKDFHNMERIVIDIKSFKKILNGNSNIQSGNWHVELQLNEQFSNTSNEIFETEYNQFLNSSNVELTETSLKFELEFNINLDNSLLREINNIFLMDSLGKEYNYKLADLEHPEQNISKLYLEYDIGKYFNNISNFELTIKNNAQDIILKFKR